MCCTAGKKKVLKCFSIVPSNTIRTRVLTFETRVCAHGRLKNKWCHTAAQKIRKDEIDILVDVAGKYVFSIRAHNVSSRQNVPSIECE